MDGMVPDQYQLGPVAGVLRDHDSLSCLANELLELLRHGDDDGAGSSGAADEKLPPTPPPAVATNIANHQLILSTAREAEMASWLCQVFEDDACDHEPQRSATTKPGGSSSTAHGSSASGHGSRNAAAGTSTDGVAVANAAIKTECCRGRLHPSRSWSFAARAAEQRRRDKINEKLRTLHQLVPWCKKTDKASTLEEVIRYVKFLQHQLQMLSNGYDMKTAMILPPGGVVPPPCMQPAGDAFGMQPVIMLPRYPFVPAMFACPHHGNDGLPLPPPLYHHPVVGSCATQQVLDHHRIISDLAVAPSRRKANLRTTKLKEKAEMSARSNRTKPPM